MARRLTLIEFVKDTEKRPAGTRLWVDAGSAVSLVDKRKVAKRVEAEPAPAADEPEAPRRRRGRPQPDPEPDPVPAETESDDE